MTQTWSPETARIQSQDLENTAEARVGKETARRRYERIAEAAYRRAEQRHFRPGGEVEDWLAAEREIDAIDAQGRGSA